MTTRKKDTESGRGSKEAIAKRRAARQLNAVLGGGRHRPGLDGRTEKRRQRLIQELKEGRNGIPLTPIDFVTHVNDLLEIGETVANLRRQGVKPRKTELNDGSLAVIRQTQDAYGFHPEAWKLLGVKLPPSRRRKGAES